MDGLRRLLILCCLLLVPALAKADPAPDSIQLEFMANGRMFQSLNVVMTKDGRKYPVYYTKDENGGRWGYSYGQIAVELKNILYDADIAERIGADDYITYDDLEITFFEVDNPFKVNRMMKLLEKEPMVRYAEISLIEDLNW